ncbi:TPA: hypothetical protein ACIAH1_004043 [Enterobacter hormaechei subsp. steigerwaltii]
MARVGCIFQKHAEENYLISEAILSFFTNAAPAGMSLINLSSHQFDEFYNKRKELRLQIRKEMGSLDLKMAEEDLDKLSE